MISAQADGQLASHALSTAHGDVRQHPCAAEELVWCELKDEVVAMLRLGLNGGPRPALD